MTTSNSNLRLRVLGCGSAGVCTALQLQSKFPNASIELLGAEFEKDTTSYGAAGLYAPYCFSGPTSEITRIWLDEAWNFWTNILNNFESARSGVQATSGYTLSNVNGDFLKDQITPKIVPYFKILKDDELNIFESNWKYGVYSESVTISSISFLPFALAKFQSCGGRVIQIPKINSFDEIANDGFDYLFNCTGLGSKWLCNDPNMIPIRGQVIKVKAPWVKNFVISDSSTYIIPNVNEVTLGGSCDFGDWNTNILPHQSKFIKEHSEKLIPELKRAEYVREWAGLRPYRSPCRVEYETVTCGNGRPLRIVHNYGHGGSGASMSPGTSAYAVKILEDNLRKQCSKL